MKKSKKEKRKRSEDSSASPERVKYYNESPSMNIDITGALFLKIQREYTHTKEGASDVNVH